MADSFIDLRYPFICLSPFHAIFCVDRGPSPHLRGDLKTGRCSELEVFRIERIFTPHNMSHVMCHVSRVMCHVSCVTCHVPHVTCHMLCVTYHNVFLVFFFVEKVVKLIGGGSVINEAYSV